VPDKIESRVVRVNLTAPGAGIPPRPQIVVPFKLSKQRVVVTCAFGAAAVNVAFRENLDAILNLPNAGTWEWELEPEEGLYATTTVNTVISGVVKDVG
jgi:hypothetical protein